MVTGAMLLLLPLMAILQYLWLGDLSESKGEQMKTHLQSVAYRFSQDFDQEITRTYAAFVLTPEMRSDDRLSDYASSYQRWSKSSAYPGLVKTVYLALDEQPGQLNLYELDRQAQKFQSHEWPTTMTELHGQLEELVHKPNAAGSPASGKPEQHTRPPQVVNEELPALLLIIVEPSPEKPKNDSTFIPPQIAGFAILQLDLPYIQQEMLPEMLKHHFLPGEGSDYDLTIFSRKDQRRIIYQSDPRAEPRAINTTYDASSEIFGLRVDELRHLLRGSARRGDYKEMNRANWRAGGGPAFGTRGLWEGGGLWQVRIRHRAGSLEAAVDSLRRRNMVISFGILGLLGASIAMLTVSARRARRLAEQQMDFVAGVSHELRTPLAVIESAAYNLDKGVIKTPQQIKSYGALIRKETGHLKDMVEQILELAGEQSGRLQYDLQAVSINRILADVISSSQPLLAEGGFQIECDIAADLPPVLGDQAALARTIRNLIFNAMKYSGESKWIGLSAKEVETASGKFVQITVADHGIGIDDKELSQIFEPFYRGSAARAAQIHGNGLGLSLIKNVIITHHGTIDVKSMPGRGSSFVISLPVMTEAQPNDDRAPTVPGEFSYE